MEFAQIIAFALGAYNVGKYAVTKYKQFKGKAGEYQSLIDGLKLVVATVKK